MKVKFKKIFFLLIILIFSFMLFSSCTILDRIFGGLFSDDGGDNNTSGVKFDLKIWVNTSQSGDLKIGVADTSGPIPGHWIYNFTPNYITWVEGGPWVDPWDHTIYDLPDGDWYVKVFIDVNNNGDIDPGEAFGELPIHIDSYEMSQYSDDIYLTDPIGPDAFEYNDDKYNSKEITMDYAETITDLTLFADSGDGTYDEDWFWFEAQDMGDYVIKVDNITGGMDIKLELYDDYENLLYECDMNGEDGYEEFTYYINVTGYYHIRIYAINQPVVGFYTLHTYRQ